MTLIDPTERLSRQMARLNPSNVRFDIGAGGGAPSLTPQDVAAALGMVSPGFGLELLLAVHWPDAAKRNRPRLLELMTIAQLREHNNREQAMHHAMCQVATSDARDKDRAVAAYNAAHLSRWPQIVVKHEPLTFAKPYADMRLAVIEELTHPRQCPECGGKDLRDRLGKPKTCERCMGQGVVSYGPTWRSKRLGMDYRSGFTRWQAPYEWLINTCREQLAEAEESLRKALR